MAQEASSESRPPDSGGAPDLEGMLRPAEVLRAANITHQVLYRYVTLGLIEPAAETESGGRLYHPNVIVLIDLIQGMLRSGYALRDLKEIFFKDERVRRALARDPESSAND